MNQSNKILFLLGFIIILGIWEASIRLFSIPVYFLPAPIVVVKTLVIMVIQQNFLGDVLVSIYRVLAGFCIALVLAIPVGLTMGLNKKVEDICGPVIDFIRYTPIPAFIPLFILWFGIGETEKIVVIISAVFFQIVIMIANSVQKIPLEIIQTAQILGASHWQIIFKIIWPYILPNVWDDMRINLGWAWSGVILAEVVGATHGIGYVIIQSQRLLQTPSVMAAIVVVGIIGACQDILFKKLYAHWFPWAPKFQLYARN